ncbi:competence protein CoiA family protein [Nocardioides aquaticus]|uniref:competence protein CoiA family protein n=1 Tax=Nocardioides aquaticus TaxID=160826 RepID=UPI001BD275B1|nr:competence protein CoiA family protein [Nocardioides aquaticus]
MNRAASGRRDGFSHRAGSGGHAPESLFHQQGKAAILAWVSSRYPHVVAAAEVPLPQRSRVADVMLTWPDGAQVAVEIQYAQLGIEEWTQRNQAYLTAGVTPVWLFGHHGAQMRTSATTEGATLVKLSTLHQHMLGQGAQPLWINPIDATLGTPWARVAHPDGGAEGALINSFQVHCPLGTTAARFAVT